MNKLSEEQKAAFERLRKAQAEREALRKGQMERPLEEGEVLISGRFVVL